MKKIAAILIGIAVLVIAILVTAFVLSKPAPSDPLPPDLQVIRHNIPAESNAFIYFVRVTNLVWEVGSGDVQMKSAALLTGATNWDEMFVADLIRSNEQALAMIDRGLTCDQCECPEMMSLTSTIPYLTPWRQAGRVMSLKARKALQTGQHDEALNQAFKTLRFGQMIVDGSGSLIHYLLGVAIKGMALNEIERTAESCSLPSSNLLARVRALSAFDRSHEGARNALRYEYVAACDLIDTLPELAYGSKPGLLPKIMISVAKVSYVYQPAQTKALFATTCRMWIRDIDKTYAETTRDASVQTDWIESQKMWTPNFIGRSMHAMMAPALESGLERACRDRAMVRCCQLLLALKAYHHDHGNLPATLDALVPDYLEQVPADPFDGKPMRYSAEKKIVWSVDDNLKDDGGSDADRETGKPPKNRYAHWHGLDIVFQAEF